jgi:hypothetical protein
MAARQATADYIRAAAEASKRLTIVIHEASVTITDAEGRVQDVPTDNKKIESRAGNGLVKLSLKNHWDGATLVCEAEIEFGPKIVRKFSVSPGGTELRLTTTVEGQGQPISLLRFYERPFDTQQ